MSVSSNSGLTWHGTQSTRPIDVSTPPTVETEVRPMRTFVIGDVHGMADELEALVDKLSPEKGDRFAFLGDLVDKGPESQRVIRIVRDLIETWDGFSLCGNHEDSVMRLYAKAQKAGTWDGLRKVEREPWIKRLTEDEYQWLRSLPLVARPLDGVIMVHGGMSPRYFEKHSEVGEVTDTWHKGGGKRMDRMRRFLRIRHVYREDHEKAGQMVSLGNEGTDTQPWGDWYDGREGFAFYGHAPQRNGRPVLHPHAMGLDTGAVFGARLTAAVVEAGPLPVIEGETNFVTKAGDGSIRVRLVSVQAGRAHAEWLEAFEAD